MLDTSHKESKWHPHLDMSFLGCVLAFAIEVYFEEHIFIPHGGGASFGLIALIVINFMTIPVVIVVTTLFCYLFKNFAKARQLYVGIPAGVYFDNCRFVYRLSRWAIKHIAIQRNL